MPNKTDSKVNPSPKNGHIDVSNELAEQFAKKIRISGEEWQVLWVVLRQTWGWHEPWAKISLQQFKDATGIIKPRISRLLHKLQDKKVITQKGNKNPHSWHVNSHYDQWKPLPKKVTTQKVITQKGNTGALEQSKGTNKQALKEEITQKGTGLTQKGTGLTQKGNNPPSNELSPRDLQTPKETINKESTNKETINKETKHSGQKNAHKKQSQKVLQIHQLLVEQFKKLYEQKYRATYVDTKKDFVMSAKLLKKVDLQEAERRLNNAFIYKYWFDVKTFGQFSAHFNDLIQESEDKFTGIRDWLAEKEQEVQNEQERL